MDEQKDKRTVEWSFSFEKLGDQISDFVKSATDKEQLELKHQQFKAALDGAISAQVRIDLAVGEANITALSSESANLLEADLTYVGEVELMVEGETEKVVRLRQKSEASDWVRGASGWFNNRQPLRWDVVLTPTIPLNLEVHSGAGRSNFDLSALKLTGLHVASGAGELVAKFPAGEYEAKISGGVGRSAIQIPADAFVNLNLSSGAGEVNLDIAEGAALVARISGGVGACNVRVPAGAAVRLEARTGIGSINVGGLLQRVSGKGGDFWDKGGVWETANFEDAERQIVISFNGGVGAFTLR
ncbi:MAG: hypothetical protein ABI835_08885 [Chloroflexota bacterium]